MLKKRKGGKGRGGKAEVREVKGQEICLFSVNVCR